MGYLDSNRAVISPPREEHSYFSVILPDFVPTYICARPYLFCLCSFIKQRNSFFKEVNNSVILGAFSVLCIHHLCLFPRHSSYPRRRPCAYYSHSHSCSFSHLPKCLAATNSHSLSMDLRILDIPYKRNHNTVSIPYLQVPHSRIQPTASQIYICSWLNLRMQNPGIEGAPAVLWHFV